jgi:hypothetical protein
MSVKFTPGSYFASGSPTIIKPEERIAAREGRLQLKLTAPSPRVQAPGHRTDARTPHVSGARGKQWPRQDAAARMEVVEPLRR